MTDWLIDVFSGNEATLNFYLTNYTDVGSLVRAVRNIAYLGGNTNTTGGLRLMRTEIFNVANGDRPDVPNVALLITDGIPTREFRQLPDEVRRIKDSGTRIVTVGVTKEVQYYLAGRNGSSRRSYVLLQKFLFFLRGITELRRPIASTVWSMSQKRVNSPTTR